MVTNLAVYIYALVTRSGSNLRIGHSIYRVADLAFVLVYEIVVIVARGTASVYTLVLLCASESQSEIKFVCSPTL